MIRFVFLDPTATDGACLIVSGIREPTILLALVGFSGYEYYDVML